jgi:hypothetical protein
MRTILLAGAAALALSVAPAMAGSHSGSSGFINKSANAAGGSNSASTGGLAGNGNGNTHVNVSHSLDGNRLNSDNTTTTVQGNSAAGSLAGNAASATDGGLAINAALGSYDVSNKALDNNNTSVAVTLASAANHGAVYGNSASVSSAAPNNVTNALNGQGILTGQLNTGANSFQQTSVALGSVVTGGTGGGFVGGNR